MRLTFDRLWTWIAIALPAFVALLVPLPAVDLAYQVRAGNEILAAGALPGVDTWTFTVAGTAWLDQQWLAQVKLAVGYAIGGWELLAVLRAVLVGATTGLLVATARSRGAGPRTAAILALVAFALAAPALALRPQLFAIALFAALLWLIAVRGRRPRLFLLAPILVVLWANVHGSFVLGPALLGYAWLDDVAARRPWRVSFAVLVAGTLATLVNPYLAGVWAYAVGIGANPAIAGQVSEWQRTSPFAMPGLLFYPAVIVTVMLALWRRSSMRWPDWVLLAAMAIIGAWAVRGVAWWAFVMTFLLAGILALPGSTGVRHASSQSATPPPPGPGASPWAPEALAYARGRRASRLNGATAALLGVLVLAALPWWRPLDPLTGRMGLLTYAPSGLAAAVAARAGPEDRVVVPQTWGSWFEWAAPAPRYFIDSRFELYPAGVWEDNAAIVAGGDSAAEALEHRGATLVVVASAAPSPSGPWVSVWSDTDGAILVPGLGLRAP